MKKKINWQLYLTLAALVLTTAAFLFPIGTGLVRTSTHGSLTLVENFRGYDFIFGNNANQIYSTGGFIGAFCLMVIAAVFQLIACIFVIPNPEGSHNFAGFMNFVAGLCIIATGVIFIFTKSLSPISGGINATFKLGWGNLIAAACAILSGLISCVMGFAAMKKKA